MNTQNEKLEHLFNIHRIVRDNISLLKKKDISYFIELVNPNNPEYKFYRISPEFQSILTSAGADIPNPNNINFYKIILFLNDISDEHDSFDEYYIIENLLREVNWEQIMN